MQINKHARQLLYDPTVSDRAKEIIAILLEINEDLQLNYEHEKEALLVQQIINEQIINGVDIGIRVVDKNRKIIACNQVYADLNDNDINDLVDHYCYDFPCTSNCNTDSCSLQRVINGEVIDIELVIKKNDVSRYIDFRVKPYFSHVGEIIGIIEMFQDTTKKRLAQKELQNSKHLLSLSQKIAELGYWVFTPHTNSFSTFSTQARKILNFSENGEITIDNLFDVIYREDLPYFQKKIDELFYNNRIQATNRIIVNNSIRWIRIMSELHVNIDEAIMYIGTVQDITEHVQANLALQSSEEKYRNLVENISEGIYQTTNGIFISVNRALSEMFGYKQSEIIGKPAWMLARQEIREDVKRMFFEMANTKTCGSKEVECIKKDGTLFWTKISISNYINTNQVFGTVTDISEIKTKEYYLAEHEKNLKESQRIAKIGSWTVNLINGEEYFTPELFNILDISENNTLKLNTLTENYVLPQYQHLVDEQYFEVFKNGNNNTIEFEIITAQKNRKWLRSIAAPLEFDSNGRISKANGILMDITETKKIENASYKNQTKYETLIRNATDAIILCTFAGEIVEANQATYELLGWETELPEKLKLQDCFFKPAEWEIIIKAIHKFGSIKTFETQIKNHNQSKIYVIASCSIITDLSNENLLFFMLKDVTEQHNIAKEKEIAIENRKIKQKEIQIYAETVEYILQTNSFTKNIEIILQNAVNLCDASFGKIIFINNNTKTLRNTYTINSQEPTLISHGFKKRIKELQQILLRKVNLIIENSQPEKIEKQINLLPNIIAISIVNNKEVIGCIILAHKKQEGFTDDNKNILLTFANYASIAYQRNSTIISLNEQAAKLKELNNSKDKFFSLFAHDLKSPFNAIYSTIEKLNKNFETLSHEELKNNISTIFETSRHFANLIENLLIWSQVQTNNFSINKQKTDIYKLVSGTVDLYKNAAALKNISLKINFEERCQFVLVDKNMITAVIMNLLSNAIKFSFENSEIIIGIEKINNAQLRITVKDFGKGMSKNAIKAIYNSSAISTLGTNLEKGTGIGLQISKEFLEKHASQMMINSALNKGTFISFVLDLID